MAKQPSKQSENAARELLSQLRIQSPPIPVEKIAKSLGALVRFAAFDNELSGMIHIKDGIAIIGVNSLHHPNRQRFTIAHELGHLQLHRDLITSEIHVDKDFPGLMRDEKSTLGTERIEIEANEFASELLMPREFIAQALKGRRLDIDDEGPIDELAKKFKVSKQALMFRILNNFQ